MGNDRPPRLGSAEETILRLLVAGGELYGLEMVKRSSGALKRGTVYVFLNRMEDKGFVSSRVEEEREPGQRGLPRRRYRVTGLGERALRAWERASAAWSGDAGWGLAGGLA